jgi:hypothetical protein
LGMVWKNLCKICASPESFAHLWACVNKIKQRSLAALRMRDHISSLCCAGVPIFLQYLGNDRCACVTKSFCLLQG